jgi:hypothetical protein
MRYEMILFLLPAAPLILLGLSLCWIENQKGVRVGISLLFARAWAFTPHAATENAGICILGNVMAKNRS